MVNGKFNHGKLMIEEVFKNIHTCKALDLILLFIIVT